MVLSRKRRWKATDIIDQNLKIVSLLQISFRKGAAVLKAVWPNDIFTCTSTVWNTVKSLFVPEAIGNAKFNMGLVLPAMTNYPAMGSAADCWTGLQTNRFPARPRSSDRRYRRRYQPGAGRRRWRTCYRGTSSYLLLLDHYSMPSAPFFARDSYSPRIGLRTFLLPESENVQDIKLTREKEAVYRFPKLVKWGCQNNRSVLLEDTDWDLAQSLQDSGGKKWR